MRQGDVLGTNMQITYDRTVNIAYIRLKNKTQKVQTVVVSDQLNVDMTPDGTVYGIELLNANAQLGGKQARTLKVVNRASGETAEIALAG